jgi:hypothetical protein
MMILAAMLLVQTLSGKQVAACDYDRPAMLALDLRLFDQDMNGGWRTLEARGCVVDAADLIRDWRKVHGETGPTDTLLSWHEGQLRADAGQYRDAIKLLNAGRHPAADDAKWGWNLYVEGSVAFLRGDRHALEAARAKLAALPRPPELKDAVGADGKPRPARWPMNIRVLDSFIRCWGQSYMNAYRCSAPAPAAK